MKIKRPKILIYLPNLQGGGAENVITILSNEFIKLNQKVLLVVDHKHGPNLKNLSKKIDLYSLDTSNFLKRLYMLLYILRKNNPCIFLSTLTSANILGFLATSLLGMRHKHFVRVAAHHTWSIKYANSIKRKLGLYFMVFIFRYCGNIISVSKSVTNDLKSNWKINGNKIHTISNPFKIDVRTFDLSSNKSTSSFLSLKSKSNISILSSGRFVYQKGFNFLLDTFFDFQKDFPGSSLTILGEGPQHNALFLRAKELKISHLVNLPGYVDDIAKYFLAADVFVLTSLWEGMPNVLLDAFSYNLPIIATDSPGGTAEMLEYGSLGALIPVNDKNALLSELNNILKFKYLSGFDRKILFKKYSPSNIAVEYLEAFF